MKVGKLVPFEDIAQELGVEDVPPLGGPPKIQEDWMTNRFNWRDEAGIPIKPRWNEATDAIKHVAEQQAEARNNMLTQKSVVITVDEQELFDEYGAMLQQHPSVREKVYQNMLEKVKAVQGSLGPLKGQKQWEKNQRRARAKEAKAHLHIDYLDKCRQYMKEGLTAVELAERIVPKTKRKSKGKKIKGKGAEMWRKLQVKCGKMRKSILLKRNKKKDTMPKELEAGPLEGKRVRVCKDLFP